MIVKLFDRTEIVVSKTEADKIIQSIRKSSDGYITVKGSLIKKSGIAQIKPGGNSQADAVKLQEKGLIKIEDKRDSKESYDRARKKSESIRELLIKKGIMKKL